MKNNQDLMLPVRQARSQRRQSGATLIIALIMLIMLTMLAVTSFNIGKGNLQIVGNMQQRNEALTAAQARIEAVISNRDFAEGTVPASVTDEASIDARGAGVADVKVTVATPVAAKCAGAEAKADNLVDVTGYTDLVAKAKQDKLNLEETVCIPTQVQAADGTTIKSYPCRDAVWEVAATAKDAVSNANVTQVQGIAIRREGACI